MYIIDRRLNPQGKSLANRQRFLRRAKQQIARAVREASARRGIQDIDSGDKIVIPNDGINEPSFRRSADGGIRDLVLPGNKIYVEGDIIPRPERDGAAGGSDGSADGGGNDDFRFVLSREEFLDVFLEDLELPDLVKQNIKRSETTRLVRAGFTVTGAPANLNLSRTMRNSLSRRVALRRPKRAEIERLEQELADREAAGATEAELADLREQLTRLRRRSLVIPFLDPLDVRFSRFQTVRSPAAQAVMFCLMDVSGSMTEYMKDLAKRFFMLLYLFLTRRYRSVDIVFIRHSHEAREVDEDTFFYSTETGGTVVSTALEEMQRVLAARYPVADWNIYAAQASDGDNLISDNARAASLLADVILPVCQYFAYLEVGPEMGPGLGPLHRDTELWRTYRKVATAADNMAMRKVRSRQEIFPVFRDLFSKEKNPALG